MTTSADCFDDHTIDRLFHSQLSHDELARMDAHMDRCSACRELVSNLAADDDAASAPPPVDDKALATGTVLLDRFVLHERVGSGGMAEIFRGYDRTRGAAVAIKVPHASGPDDESRFEREAALLVELDHTGIVKHIAEGRTQEGTPFLVMEWLEGEDLAHRLRRGPLTFEETITVGERIASALAASSGAGVIHRDVKPSNIFLKGAEASGATLIDFGVARRAAAVGLTRTGMLLGTLGYMAPEQALGAKTAGARADIFSLGCVLFECVNGKRLFEGAHAVEILAKLLTHSVSPLRTLVPKSPPAFDALLRRMLARAPASRPASATEVAVELARIRASGFFGSRLARRIALVLAMAATVAGTITVAVLTSPSRRSPVLSTGPVTAAATTVEATAGASNDPPLSPPPTPSFKALVGAPKERPRAPISVRVPVASSSPGPSTAPATVDPFGSSRN